MNLAVVVLIATGLSMDAFAVSVCNGIQYRMPLMKNAVLSGLAFGLLQGIMPLIGYFLGAQFVDVVNHVAHWIILFILSFIGIHMIYEVWHKSRSQCSKPDDMPFSFRTLMLQSIATSIDALAVGVGLGMLGNNIFISVTIISLVTFFICFAGVAIGKFMGDKLSGKAPVVGGIILILIGIKCFVDGFII